MVKNILFKPLLTIGLVLIFFGCSSLPEAHRESNNKGITSNASRDLKALASKAYTYPNLKSLVMEADLIVKGRVAENLPSDLAAQGESEFVISLFEFKIDEIIYNSESQSIPSQGNHPRIVIFQAGGEYQEINQPPVKPNQLLEKEKEYVLFLKYLPEAQGYGPKDKLKYGIVGEYSGQFQINVHQTRNISLSKGEELKYPVEDLKVQIKQLVKDTSAIKGPKIAKEKRWNSFGQEIRGIASALPEYWEYQISFDKGKIGSPQGLMEPVAKINFTNPRIAFEADRNKKLNPSLTIFYYDIKEKEKIRQTVEDNAHFSGPIPNFYAETKNYIIVTSPYYTNHGYILKGKLFLLPLDVALQKFFAQF